MNNDKVLVLIELTGGNDGLNTVIPLDVYSQYLNARPNLAIPTSKILKLTDTVGLHHALTGFRNMFVEGKLGIIQNVGMPNPNFSHFRASDIWNSASNSEEIWDSGWLGRMFEYNYPAGLQPSGIKIGTVPTLSLQGKTPTINAITVASDQAFYDFLNGTESIPAGEGGKKMSYIRDVRRTSETFSAEVKKAASLVTQQVTYPSHNSLADQLKIIARLIGGGMTTKVYIAALNGFDTHATQVESTDPTLGQHAYLLQMLSDAVEAFQKDLEFLGVADKVIGMTYSEFGRTAKQNASRGTDHGHAAPLFYFGKGLSTNKIFGSSPNLAFNELPHQYDFRQIYASALNYLGSDADTVLQRHFDAIPIIGDTTTTTTTGVPSTTSTTTQRPTTTTTTTRPTTTTTTTVRPTTTTTTTRPTTTTTTTASKKTKVAEFFDYTTNKRYTLYSDRTWN